MAGLFRMVAAAAAVGALAAACTPTIELPTGPPSGGASQVVDQSGGTLTTDEGTTLVIPPGALTAATTITIALVPDAAAPAGLTPVTAAHVFGPEGQKFNVPVCITLAYEPEQVPDGTVQSLVLYTAPAGSEHFEAMPTITTDATHVMGTTLHFSTVLAAFVPDGGGLQELAADSGLGCDAGDGGDAAPE